ncbi:hypothetical protein Tco_1088235, partial [Tanacetum coccineum]
TIMMQKEKVIAYDSRQLKIHEARVEAPKKENVKDENFHVSPMARYGKRHHHLCQQVLGVFKDEERLPEAIRFTGTIRNTPWEIGKNVAMDFITRLPEKTSSHDTIWASPWEGVIRFSKQGKLNPRYIRSFKILAKVGTLAYRLERLLSTFHVSNLKKCFVDEPLAILLDEIQIDDKLNFIEKPAKIMDREVKQLNQNRILIMKVCWNSRRGPEFT